MLKGYRGTEEELSFSDIIRNVGEQLLRDRTCDVTRLAEPVDQIFSYIDALSAFYHSPSPPCTETVRSYMIEGLALYRQCMAELTAHFHDRKEEHIHKSIALAVEAEDILKSLEIVMAENAAILDLEGRDGH